MRCNIKHFFYKQTKILKNDLNRRKAGDRFENHSNEFLSKEKQFMVYDIALPLPQIS